MKTKSHSPVRPSTFKVIPCAAAAALLLFAGPAVACGSGGTELRLIRLAGEAVSTDEDVAARAIAALRESGPAGLEALFAVHSPTAHEQLALDSASPDREAAQARLCRAIETVGRQRDGITSRLYWFTELEKAKAAAKASGKPILSLRLLGQLDEEFSCANSRFFRTALYANVELSRYLREHFVLHWESVRPVPRITIDFGDGRKLERTITGNSIHYVLDAEGRPLDALPGLYGPKAFYEALAHAGKMARQYASGALMERDGVLREYHGTRLAVLTADWNRDLTRAGAITPVANTVTRGTVGDPLRPNPPPTAGQAARVARGKSGVEIPMIRSLAPRSALDGKSMERSMTDDLWSKVAALHLDDAKLDAASRRLMFRKLDARQAARIAMSEAGLEHTLLRATALFERSMSEDTVRNEYLLHSKIHEWFAGGQAVTRHVAALNERVYAELFLTPGSDPWLGLKPAETYSALPGDGVIESMRK